MTILGCTLRPALPKLPSFRRSPNPVRLDQGEAGSVQSLAEYRHCWRTAVTVCASCTPSYGGGQKGARIEAGRIGGKRLNRSERRYSALCREREVRRWRRVSPLLGVPSLHLCGGLVSQPTAAIRVGRRLHPDSELRRLIPDRATRRHLIVQSVIPLRTNYAPARLARALLLA